MTDQQPQPGGYGIPGPGPSGPPTPPPPPPAPPTGYPPPPPMMGRPTPPKSGGSIWLGMLIGILGTAAIYGGTAWGSTRDGTPQFLTDALWTMSLAWPIVVLVGGIIMAVIPKTSRTGAGLLISIGVVILAAGGLCVALLTGASMQR